jgi:hypothetical protein
MARILYRGYELRLTSESHFWQVTIIPLEANIPRISRSVSEATRAQAIQVAKMRIDAALSEGALRSMYNEIDSHIPDRFLEMLMS